MALNFPDSPTLNQVYTDSTSGFSYQWNGTVWKSFSGASSSQILILNDISGSFNGSTQTFPLTSSGNAIATASAKSLIINLGGVIQDPSDDYSVSGSNIVFSTAPTSGLTFSGVSLGPAVPIGTILDGTVTEGSLRISTKAVVGAATTFTEDLVVNGSARVVGVLTVGTGSLTLNGTTNTINGVTISSGIVTATTFVGSLTGTATGLSGTPNVTVGVITATSAVIGTGVTLNSSGINVTGIVTASSFVGSLTGTATGLTGTPNVTVGVLTATTLVGSLTGNATGLSGTPNVTVGVLTATAISAGSTTGTSGQLLQSTGTGVTWTAAPVVGAASSVLYTTGSGVLDWISPASLIALGLTSTDGLAEGTTNLYFTTERAQDAVGAAINAGIQTGMTVTYDDANNSINFNNAATTPYPFTTRGFSIPI